MIAGSTGSGKSICLNGIIVSLLYKYSPEELRFILIDPKKVEFTTYEGLPHLLIDEIICENEKALKALQWMVDEMERRYVIFSETGVRDIASYNAVVDPNLTERLPRIVLVIDELADFMMYNKNEVEAKIKKLTAKARAAGIHLILATQRPSVNVITGDIKSNITALSEISPAEVRARARSEAETKAAEAHAAIRAAEAMGAKVITSKPAPSPEASIHSNPKVIDLNEFDDEDDELDYGDEYDEEETLKEEKPKAGKKPASGFSIFLLAIMVLLLLFLLICLVVMLMKCGIIPGADSGLVRGFAIWFNSHLFPLF